MLSARDELFGISPSFPDSPRDATDSGKLTAGSRESSTNIEITGRQPLLKRQAFIQLEGESC